MKLRIHERFFVGSGAGGQHRNRTESCVEAWVELPDGRKVSATASGERSQYANRRAARAVLRARVREALEPPGVGRGAAGEERVRTYHEPDNRVVDHLSGERGTWDGVMLSDAGFAKMIAARRRAARERELGL